MNIELAKELDKLMTKARSERIVGCNHKDLDEEGQREMALYDHIYKEYKFLDKTKDGLCYIINGDGIMVLEENKNKPFEIMFRRQKRAKTWKIVERMGIGLWTLLCSIISAIGGVIIGHFIKL